MFSSVTRSLNTLTHMAVTPFTFGGKVMLGTFKHSIPHHPTVGTAAFACAFYAKAQAQVGVLGILTDMVVQKVSKITNKTVGAIFARHVAVPMVVPPLVGPVSSAIGFGVGLGVTWVGNSIADRLLKKNESAKPTKNSEDGWDDSIELSEPVGNNWNKIHLMQTLQLRILVNFSHREKALAFSLLIIKYLSD